MNHQLSVLVQVDLHGRYVCLLVTGCLTEASHEALRPVIHGIRNFHPGIRISVDLTRADHVEATAVHLLRSALDHHHTTHPTGPVELILPDPLPNHVATSATADAPAHARTAPRTGFTALAPA